MAKRRMSTRLAKTSNLQGGSLGGMTLGLVGTDARRGTPGLRIRD